MQIHTQRDAKKLALMVFLKMIILILVLRCVLTPLMSTMILELVCPLVPMTVMQIGNIVLAELTAVVSL